MILKARWRILAAPVLTILCGLFGAGSVGAEERPTGVGMIDLGAKACIPCKIMAPILVELEKEYAGRAVIRFIDVKENPAKVEEYGIQGIPTQIFYDKTGREVKRNLGVMQKDEIKAVLDKLLADKP